MITLRPINKNDINLLDLVSFATMSYEDRLKMIEESLESLHDGNYFELLLAFDGDSFIGYMNLYAHSEHIISCGPEIATEHRRKGYAYEAEKLALAYAKEKGFTVAVAYIREDNTASIKLHEKLGFELDSNIIRNNKNMLLFIKAL